MNIQIDLKNPHLLVWIKRAWDSFPIIFFLVGKKNIVLSLFMGHSIVLF